ncbi:MAG: hypothetical protein J5606_09435 [Bacteroidales bacterium]|nr:hypothetical protein [Bacteroidales bacterium]
MKKNLLKDAQAVLNAYKKMETYQIQENVLQTLVKEFPDHKNKAAIEVKVKLLNLLYSTNVRATNNMTKHILEIKDIDKRLKNGDKTLVPEIANIKINDKTYNFYSFATKYCAYHEPDKFPIYDNIVANVLTALYADKNKKEFEKKFEKKLREYDYYVQVYDTFMKEYGLDGLTYRKVDNYIWGAYKIAGVDFEIEKIAPIDKSKIIEVEI